MTPITVKPYDLKPVYNDELVPLIDEIRRICNREKLPFVMCFQTQHGPEGPTVTNTVQLMALDRSDPYIRLVALVANQPEIAKLFQEHLALAAAEAEDQQKAQGQLRTEFQDMLEDIHKQAAQKLGTDEGSNE